MTFAVDALRHSGPVLCAGLDPSAQILAAWGLPDTPEGLTTWAAQAASAVLETGARVVKPQVAFFERHGLAGMRALAHLMATLRSTGVYVIADAKRGDIGTSVDGYAAAWLTTGADFEADALTLHPFHGVGSLGSTFDFAHSQGKTVFVLVATSNPEGIGLQSAATASGETVSQLVLREMADYVTRESLGWSAVGAVVGATVDWKKRGLSLDMFPDMPLLSPGYGAQGADFATAGSDFPSQNLVLPVSARGLLDGGVDEFIDRTRAAMAGLESP
jgi:orotidine-5'-phosphate decarboxylase